MRIWILAIATVAVLIGAVGGAYWYGGNGADESTLVLNRAPAASDGIKLHGDWTLTVSNPDGSVDSVHEFKNDLTDKGASFLTTLLGGDTEGYEYNGVNTIHAVRFWRVRKFIEANSDGLGDYFQCKERIDHSQMGEGPLWATIARESSPGNPLIMSENCTLVWVKDIPIDNMVVPESPGTKTGKLNKVDTRLYGQHYNHYLGGETKSVQKFKYFNSYQNKNVDTTANGITFTEYNLSGDDQIDVTEGQLLNLQVRFSFE